MKYLHTMVRVKDLDASLDFYCNKKPAGSTTRTASSPWSSSAPRTTPTAPRRIARPWSS